MTVTVYRIDGEWVFSKDAFNAARSTITQMVRVPEGSEWVELVDCTRPDRQLHAVDLKLGHLRFCANAHVLIMLADMPKDQRWPGIEPVLTQEFEETR